MYNEHRFEGLQVYKHTKYSLKWSSSKRRDICNEHGYFPKHAPVSNPWSACSLLTDLHISNTCQDLIIACCVT
jgi:hypothetical protein